jgi:KEOPS complex subunit Pcc1
MTHSAVFRCTTPHAAAICRAVIVENEEINPRSRIAVRLEGDTLVLEVEADDLAALRAALNMWLRLISVAEEMQEIAAGAGEEATG